MAGEQLEHALVDKGGGSGDLKTKNGPTGQ